MKIKMILITTVVSAGLIGGVGYGVYYAMKSQETPVDVVPVMNVNQMYYGDGEGTLYGTVTSQVDQTVSLNDEYEIEKIYVKQGDTVKEGDPLFSYDMTLPELELEMEQLSLQTMELDKTRLEKELEKLKKTPATASLSSADFTMTASGEDEGIVEEGDSIIGIAEDNGQISGTAEAGTQNADDEILDLDGENQNPVSGGEQSDTGNGQSSGELTLDGVEIVSDPALDAAGEQNESDSEKDSEKESESETAPESETETEIESETETESENSSEGSEEKDSMEAALREYSMLLLTIQRLELTDPERLLSSELEDAVEMAYKFYCGRLADEQTAGDYQLGKAARDLLDDEKCQEAEEYIAMMVNYQALYVRLLEKEIHTRITSRGDAPLSAEIYTYIKRAQTCYRDWFTEQQADGTYQLRDSVSGMLGEEKSQELETGYVELLIDELDMSLSDLREKAEQARAEYEKLNSSTRAEVNKESVEKLESVEKMLSSETETETEPVIETETESETESEQVTETETENEPATETETGTEPVTETETETGTEPATGTETEPGTEPVTETESETAVEPVTETESESEEPLSPEDIRTYIEQFLTLASSRETDDNYLENLRSAIGIYQQMLGYLSADAIGEERNTMDQYLLKPELADNPDYFTEGLEDLYHSVCVKYVSGLITQVEPAELNPAQPEIYAEAYAAYEAARAAFEELGEWSAEIVENYILDACDMILMIQAIDVRKPQEEVLAAVIAARDAYAALPEEAKPYIWNFDRLTELMKEYGVEFETESESETESEFPWDDGYDDWGDWGDGGDGYTAEELKEMIEEKEDELKEADLDIREQKLTVRQKQRVVDGKIVKSTLNGTVVSIGSEDGSSDDDYFLKVASAEGLYAQGSMNELSLADIHVGDTISGMLQNTGDSFTAVVKEISDYPDPNGSYYSYGSENTNASYYRFLALIDDPEGLEEGDAELQLSESLYDYSDAIYLEKYFVRTESDGRSYVMKQGEDGLLTKQYVTTGKTIYGWAIEIVSGVTLEDKLAFPYGNDVVEGAKTNEVDQLDYQ